jgi:hypothetical protein
VGGSDIDVEGGGGGSEVEETGEDSEDEGVISGSEEAGRVDSRVVAVVLEGISVVAAVVTTVPVSGLAPSRTGIGKSLGSQPGT